jgi:rod shape-determining protein MreC
MNPIFKHGPSAQHRLVLVLFCSVLLIFFDHNIKSFEVARSYLQSMISPLQYLANTPKQAMTWASENIVSREQLISENNKLKSQQIIFQEQTLQLDIVKQENNRLRLLLASPLKADMKKMVAEILSVDSDPYAHQILINRGANDGVYEGQPLLDNLGVVGQVLHVGATTSRVLLITDLSHAVPVRNSRNGIRMVSSGSGRIEYLIQNHMPHSVDIKVGDLLVTSGLGGKYPEGYPVARVTAVSKDESRPFAQVLSQPVAEIDRLRYLLLLWPNTPVNTKANTQINNSKNAKISSQVQIESNKGNINNVSE